MSRSQETLRTNIGPLDALAIVVVAVLAGINGNNYGLGLIAGAMTAAAIGVWRLVKINGKQLEYVQASAEGVYEPGYPDAG
jgi:hypothetical protein